MPSITPSEYAVSTAAQPRGCTFDPVGGKIWVSQQAGTTLNLSVLDPVTGTELHTYSHSVNSGTAGPGVFLGGFLWLTADNNFVIQIDPATGALVNQFTVDTNTGDTGQTATRIATDGTFLYIGFGAADLIPVNYTGVVQMTTAGAVNWNTRVSSNSAGTDGLAFAGSFIWMSDRGAGTDSVYQINTSGTVTHTVPVPGTNLGPLIVNATFATVIDYNGNLWQVNTTTFALAGPYAIPGARFPYNLIEDPSGNIWVLDEDFGPSVFYVDVFNPASAAPVTIAELVSDITDSAGYFAYDTVSGRVWTAATSAAPAPIALALLLSGAPASGAFPGTITSFWGAGMFGGGAK
jgi:hypothetical protein